MEPLYGVASWNAEAMPAAGMNVPCTSVVLRGRLPSVSPSTSNESRKVVSAMPISPTRPRFGHAPVLVER